MYSVGSLTKRYPSITGLEFDVVVLNLAPCTAVKRMYAEEYIMRSTNYKPQDVPIHLVFPLQFALLAQYCLRTMGTLKCMGLYWRTILLIAA
jgi:hypothetical protein